MIFNINLFLKRQLLLLLAINLIALAMGIVIEFPSVLYPALSAANAEIKATKYQVSWIAASHGIAGLIGYAVLSPIFEIFGRKIVNLVINLFLLYGSFIFYVANDVYALMFARLAQGLSSGGTIISIMTLCECVSPERRGYFIALNMVSLGLGSLACHVLTFVMTWRHIAIFVSLPTCISIALLFICAESPSFYATRGQFGKCSRSFKWYRGDTVEGNRELKQLISAQTDIYQAKEKQECSGLLKKTRMILMTKTFRRSFFIVSLAILCLSSCGRHISSEIITQMLEDLTIDKSLHMNIIVAFDCFSIVALSISYFTVNRFKRRTLLLNIGFGSAFLMFLINLSIILKGYLTLRLNVKWLTLLIIVIHTFITNIGLIPIVFTIMGEVFTLEQKGIGLLVTGITFTMFYSLEMILTPVMIEMCGVEGTYSLYGLCLIICLALLQRILPETKDKTLQEIEDEIKGVVKNTENDLL